MSQESTQGSQDYRQIVKRINYKSFFVNRKSSRINGKERRKVWKRKSNH